MQIHSEPKVSYIGRFSKTENYNERYVYWMLGNFCPYSCNYCPSNLHSGTSPYHPLENILNTVNKLPKSTIMFGGGEPTYHPDFETLLERTPEIINIGIISNAARPLAFWQKVSYKLKRAILSFHSEHAILDRFMKNAIFINNTVPFVRINLVMHPRLWKQCLNAYEQLTDAGLHVIAKPILKEFGSQGPKDPTLAEYTPDQTQWIHEAASKYTDEERSIKVFDKNNMVLYKTSPAEILATNANFSGWTCHTPNTSMVVSVDGSIFDMTCNQKRKIGTIYTDFVLPTEPVICTQALCWCFSDLIGTKEKPKEMQ